MEGHVMFAVALLPLLAVASTSYPIAGPTLSALVCVFVTIYSTSTRKQPNQSVALSTSSTIDSDHEGTTTRDIKPSSRKPPPLHATAGSSSTDSVMSTGEPSPVWHTQVSHSPVHDTPEPSNNLNREQLREVFSRMSRCNLDGSDCSLSLAEFERVCNELRLGLKSPEVARLFKKLDKNNIGLITFHEFEKSYYEIVFLNSIVTTYSSPASFTVGFLAPFIPNLSGDSDEFYGVYADIRETRDRKYHGNYTQERQLWQDEIIRSTVLRIAGQPRPWVVYTCGPMGAGKGYALSWMSKHGYFPLEQIVHIDPDHFKELMPEWDQYIENNQETAESAYLQEIACEVAMRHGQHVWVDGSLRDGEWFAKVFDDLRIRFPKYSIAIFYVYASEATVRERIATRAAITGRNIPEKLIKQSLEAPDVTLRLLTPKVDFVARINNNSSTPVLEAFESVDHSGCWSSIESRFSRVEPGPTEFPMALPPMYLRRTTLGSEHFVTVGLAAHFRDYGSRTSRLVSLNTEALSTIKSSYEGLISRLKSPHVFWSGAHPVNLDPAAQVRAGIPSTAHSFLFSYPLVHDKRTAWELHRFADDPVMAFLRNGGFVYADVKGNIVAINALTFAQTDLWLQFGRVESLSGAQLHFLKVHDQFHPVSYRSLIYEGNASHFSWIAPGDLIEGQAFPPLGAFAFIFKDETEPRYFPVLSSSGS